MQPAPRLAFDPGSISALLIVDMQVYFFRLPERQAGLAEAVANINRLSAYFDRCAWPVFHVISSYSPDGSDWDLKMHASGVSELIAGEPETQVLAEVNISPAHQCIVKTRYSAFFKTGLEKTLQRAGVRRAVVVGGYTHYCVNATIFDAFAHDFVPCLITDAVISHLPDESAVMIDRMVRNGYHVLDTEAFLREWQP
jgi:NAD+ synthase